MATDQRRVLSLKQHQQRNSTDLSTMCRCASLSHRRDPSYGSESIGSMGERGLGHLRCLCHLLRYQIDGHHDATEGDWWTHE